MSDFVAEIRPHRRIYQAQSSNNIPEGFVSEMRPHFQHTTQTKQTYTQSETHDPSDKDVLNLLSDRSFSKESITQLLNGSITTLIEKLLTGHAVAKIQGQICVNLFEDDTPILVGLNKSFPKPQSRHLDYSTDLDVSIKMTDSPPSYSENSCDGSFFHHERDFYHSVESRGTEGNLSPINYSREGSHSPPNYTRDDVIDTHSKMGSPLQNISLRLQSVLSPPFQASKDVNEKSNASGSVYLTVPQTRRDSDDESGYISTEREEGENNEDADMSSPAMDPSRQTAHFNEYFCQGFDGQEPLLKSETGKNREGNGEGIEADPCEGGDEMEDDYDDDDGDDEAGLMIDESRMAVETNANHEEEPLNMKDSDFELRNESEVRTIQKKALPPSAELSNQRAEIYDERTESYACLTKETENFDLLVTSDITEVDTDVPVDLSGNSETTVVAMSMTPHPQSLVSKHPNGLMCKQCSMIVPNAAAFSDHAFERHALYSCAYCCRVFTAKNNLKRHVRLHTGLRPYKCPQCSQSFTRKDDLKGHVLRHDYSKPFRCSVCKKGYTDRACVKNHMAKEHRSRLMHVCPQCGESFDRDEAFSAHKKTHPELQQFSCSTCSFIGTNNLMTLKHSLLHNHKLFSCKPCNAYFADPFDYTAHVRKHKTSASFSQYICCFCDASLSTYDQYVRHEYSHAQGKTHACKTCKKQFKSKSLLQEHQLCHQQAVNIEITVDQGSFNKQTTDTLCDQEFSTMKPADNLPVDMQQNCEEGQLLDLSIKKPRKSNGCDIQATGDNFNSSQGLTGLTDNGVPRNGCVSDSFSLKREGEADDCASVSYAGETYRPVFNIKDNNVIQANLNMMWSNRDTCIAQRPVDSINPAENKRNHAETGRRPRSAERLRTIPRSPKFGYDRRTFNRSISNSSNGRTPLRFGPYTREKMADLALKFVAARGPKIVGHTDALKTSDVRRREEVILVRDLGYQRRSVKLSPNWHSDEARATAKSSERVATNGRTPANVPQGREIAHPILSPLLREDSGERTREDSNPETALRCHLSTFVKSEPLEKQPCNSNSRHLVLGNVEAENLTSDAAKGKAKSLNNSNNHHVCDLCKLSFKTFSELESHSVVTHKRHLCEHCKKSFTSRPNRDRHVRYHTGERPYKCDLCDQAFFRGDDLKYHRTTRHPSAQPYVCTRCSASFTWGRDLERHIRHSKCTK